MTPGSLYQRQTEFGTCFLLVVTDEPDPTHIGPGRCRCLQMSPHYRGGLVWYETRQSVRSIENMWALVSSGHADSTMDPDDLAAKG